MSDANANGKPDECEMTADCNRNLFEDALEGFLHQALVGDDPEGAAVFHADALAEAAVYLATAPKSNRVYAAWGAAQEAARRTPAAPVPLHLRNAVTGLMKEIGYGQGYRYAHDEPEAYAADERYFPDGMPEVNWYRPTDRGLEAKIAEKLAHLRELDRHAKKKD